MMRYKNQIFILFLLINCSFLLAQQEDNNSTEIKDELEVAKVLDCNALFTLNNRKIDYLDKKSYVYAAPYYKRAYNSKEDFAVFQIAKRRGTTPFIYMRIYSKKNVCINKGEVIELLMENGYSYRLTNIYNTNCEGYIVAKLKRKDLRGIKEGEGEINSIKLLSFEKDFDFYFKDDDAERLHDELQCLRYNRFKFN